MFTPERMNEVNLFIYEEGIQAVMLALARLSTMQLEDEGGAQGGAGQNRWASIATAYADQERRLRDLLEVLEVNLPEATLPADIDLENERFDVARLLDEVTPVVDAWHHDYAATTQELEQLRFLSEQMRLLAPLDVPVERLTELDSLHLAVGTMPTANLARIQTSLFRIPFVIIPAYAHGTRTLVFAATPKAYAPILDRALRSAFFQPISLPADVAGPPAQVLIEFEQQEESKKQHLAELHDQQRQLVSQWAQQVGTMWNRVRACRSLAETIQRLPVQGMVYVIAGWVPAHRLQDTINAIQQVTNGRAIIEVLEPDMTRPQVPTQLRNPRLVRSFETLVTNFGIPAYDELDPTLVVGLTFLLMYGMMFGDVGHGILLALVGLWLITRKAGMARFGPVLLLCGLSAALFGLLYGTVLGMPVLPALWLRPAEDITTILMAAVAVGVVLINLGFALYLYSNWRTRNWSRFLLENNGLAGLAFYWVLLGGGIAVWQGILAPSLWALLVLIPATFLFLREPLKRWMAEGQLKPQGGWGEWAVVAFFELVEVIISFAGNSLSFVRLGAFAVAHEALSQVVLLLAGPSGSLGWLVTMALGTIFVVAFEGLIVGIQTLRLEYYEFFGRFFRGDGRLFSPMSMSRTEQT